MITTPPFMTPHIMDIVPFMGAAATFVVFFVLMYACVRNIRHSNEPSDDEYGWDGEKPAVERSVGELRS